MKELASIPETLRTEIEQAFREVLAFDSLTPAEIRTKVAVPCVDTDLEGKEIIMTHITLGSISENFPEYINGLKELPLNLSSGRIENLELAVFLLVLKRHEPLKSVRDYFTH